MKSLRRTGRCVLERTAREIGDRASRNVLPRSGRKSRKRRRAHNHEQHRLVKDRLELCRPDGDARLNSAMIFSRWRVGASSARQQTMRCSIFSNLICTRVNRIRQEESARQLSPPSPAFGARFLTENFWSSLSICFARMRTSSFDAADPLSMLSRARIAA